MDDSSQESPDMIAIIDCEMGNLRSVANGFRHRDIEVEVTRDPAILESADGLVLPGVGAFRDGMKNLKEHDMDQALQYHVIEQGKPFLGICLGLQLVAETGEEFGEHSGLGWIDGKVVELSPTSEKFKVPHMGWNTVDVHYRSPLYENLESSPAFYFVHSYHFLPEDRSVISGTCLHGMEVTASIQRDNIYGVQFHPEKSQKEGLQLLENFAATSKVKT